MIFRATPFTGWVRGFVAFILSQSCVLVVLGLGVAVPSVRAQTIESMLNGFAAAEAQNPLPENPVIFVGSSTIANWGNLGTYFPGVPVVNRGISGTQMGDVLFNYNRWVAPYKSPLIVLYEGDNDLASGKSPAIVFNNYLTFVNRMDRDFPGTSILIVSVKPSPSRIGLIGAMGSLNGMLQNLCASRPNLRFADIFPAMLGADGQPRPELYGPDQLHMSLAGYALWQSILASHLVSAPFDGRHSFQLDFGSGVTPAAGWNAVTPVTTALEGLTWVNGQPSTVAMAMEKPFNALGQNGTVSGAVFPATVSSDSLCGNTEAVGGKSNVFPKFRFTGLDSTRAYRFTFFASQMGGSANLQTRFTATGEAVKSVLLDAANNGNKVVCMQGVVPDAAGGISIKMEPGPANTSPVHLTCLSALKVDGLLRVVPDFSPPVLVSALGRLGRILEITFNKAMDPASISGTSHFQLNPGAAVAAASLQPDGRTLTLTLDRPLYGSVTLGLEGLRDSSGNALATGTNTTFHSPLPPQGPLYVDFGSDSILTANQASTGTWNNVDQYLGGSDSGVLPSLKTGDSVATSCELRMVRRFNSSNGSGTTQSTVFPANATVDSLFGNTEAFGAGSNVFPAFQLIGLSPSTGYDFTFFASRMGATDRRETLYTLSGANTVTTSLDASNNINNTALAASVFPNAAGEITISLSPGPGNNNANHFTYLGVMKLALSPLPQVSMKLVPGNQIQIDWTGSGSLQRAETLEGPWVSILPKPVSPFTESFCRRTRQFYRLAYP